MTCAELHRHGRRQHEHPYQLPHRHVPRLLGRSVALPHPRHDHDSGHQHDQDHAHEHDGDEHHAKGPGHRHGLVDASIKRSRAGLRAVGWSLGVLGATAIAQAAVFAASGSIALLADVIHNGGDALTAVPLAAAFLMRSAVAEKRAGLFVVATIFASACVAGFESVRRLVYPAPPTHLIALAVAGAVGVIGNTLAARIRLRAGRRLDSAALIADGNHARADAYVSVAVIGSAVVVALGLPIADPLIGLGITLVMLRITLQSWLTVRGNAH
jgi:divalent metal cation (Fe/Co/Zn/Cd) transporter